MHLDLCACLRRLHLYASATRKDVFFLLRFLPCRCFRWARGSVGCVNVGVNRHVAWLGLGLGMGVVG